MQKNEIRLVSYPTHKNECEMDLRLKCKTCTIKLLEENTEKKLLDTGLHRDFLDMTVKPQATKAK